MKKIFASILFSFLFISLVNGQCYMDRHNTNKNAAWTSCTPTPSPNAERGTGHWILYNLGIKYPLGRIEFWNVNNPDLLDNGIQNIKIDISNNGQDWTEVANYMVPKAEGSGFYEGVLGPNLNGHEARFMLVTAVDNYGGNCYSLGEIRIGLSNVPDPCSNMAYTVDNNPIYDGTYQVVNEINSTGLVNGSAMVEFKAGESISLNNGFTILNGADFTAEIIDCEF